MATEGCRGNGQGTRVETEFTWYLPLGKVTQAPATDEAGELGNTVHMGLMVTMQGHTSTDQRRGDESEKNLVIVIVKVWASSVGNVDTKWPAYRI